MTVRTFTGLPSPRLCPDHSYLRVFVLTLCRRFACFAIGVVSGNAVLRAHQAFGAKVRPTHVGVNGALVADELPLAIGAGTLDAVVDRAGRSAPTDDSEALGGDDRSRRDGVRRHRQARHFEGVAAEQLGAG